MQENNSGCFFLNTVYINDSIMIFSSEYIILFLIFSKYQPLLLSFTYFSNSCISNTNCQSLSYYHHHHQSGRQFACRRSSQRALDCLSPVFAINPFHAKSVSSILSVESSFETIYTWCRCNCV